MRYIIKEENLKTNAKRIEYEINNECWECISHTKDKDGYVKVRRNGKHMRAHRYLFELYKGNIPEGMLIRHKCDNPRCINPDHLETGTQKDNVHDMVKRGRISNGTGRHTSKLTEAQVLVIRKDPRTNAEIAKDYGVGKYAIRSIKRRESWKHI
jgi:hypothetical protein